MPVIAVIIPTATGLFPEVVFTPDWLLSKSVAYKISPTCKETFKFPASIVISYVASVEYS